MDDARFSTSYWMLNGFVNKTILAKGSWRSLYDKFYDLTCYVIVMVYWLRDFTGFNTTVMRGLARANPRS